jgi:hypothetical protein
MSARLRTRLAVLLVLLALLGLRAPSVEAQRMSGEPVSQLTANFDAANARTIQQLVDSLASVGVPSQILVDKAVEGARRGAPPDRVLSVLRSYAGHLKTAQAVLGSGKRNDVYQAAANALLAGVSVRVLHDLQSLRPASMLVLPLVVVTDLTLRGVPEDSAAAYVIRLLVADARDSDLTELQQSVAQGIIAGTRPAAAASSAMQQTLRRLTP